MTSRWRLLVGAVALVLGITAPAAARDGDVAGLPELSRLFSGLPRAIAYGDPVAYVGLDTGVMTFDLTDPTMPRLLDHIYLPAPAFDLVLSGTKLFVANGEWGLTLIDAADPANLVVAAGLRLPGGSRAETRGVAVVGSNVYLAESSVAPGVDFGLRIVTGSGPFAEVGYLPLDTGALDVEVVGSHALVGVGSILGGRHGLLSINVAVPSTPTEVAYLPLGFAIHQIAIAGQRAYLAAGFPSVGALITTDISTPSAPALQDTRPILDGVEGVAVEGSMVYVAARHLGVLSYDASSLPPQRRDGLPLGDAAIAVATRRDAAFVGVRSSNGLGGFTVIDTLQPQDLGLLAWSPFAEATAAVAAPSLAYLLRRDALHVFDTSDPGAPIWQASWSAPGGDYSAMDLAGSLLAISQGRQVHLIDVVNPLLPTAVGVANVATGVAVRPLIVGDVLYVVTGFGLESFNIASPTLPVPQGALVTTGWSADLAVDGATGYLVAGDELLVLDLSGPMPSVQRILTIPGEQLYAVDVSGALLVMSGLNAHLHVLDASLPTMPVLDASLTGLVGADVRLIGDRAVVATGRDGVRVVDCSDTRNPVEEAFYDISGSAASIGNEGRILYIAGVDSQHWLLRCTTCPDTCPPPLVVRRNTLKVVKVPARDRFHWVIESPGTGVTNAHRTSDKTALPNLWMAPPDGVSFTNFWDDPFDPGPRGLAYYRVFGADCNGNSASP